MFVRFFIITALMVACISVATAAEIPTLQQLVPKTILDTSKDTVISIVVENDSIGGKGTDENYTSGVRFTYFDIKADLPMMAEQVDGLIPTFDINETTSVFYSFGQNLYTPEDIGSERLNRIDRPWAAHLYGAMGLATITDDHLDEVELSLGVVGPWALGKQTQRFVHKLLPKSPDPRGWKNQLKNEPTIGLGWVRRHPRFLAKDFDNVSLAATPFYGATLGNVHTFANGGIKLRLTPKSEQWQDTPARVRPGLPGTGFFEIPEKKWSWYLFAGAEGRAVGRNMFLDGNTFRDSHSVDKRYFVADLNAGVAVTYDQFRISYSTVYRTKEFSNQDEPSVFGTVSLGWRF